MKGEVEVVWESQKEIEPTSVRRFFPTWISSQWMVQWLGSPPFLRNEVRPFERGPTT